MRGAELWTLDSAMDSLALWWREAGLHTPAAADAVDWRATSSRERAPRTAAGQRPFQALPQPPAIASATSAPTPSVQPAPQTVAYPADLPAFLAMLAGPEQVEAGWSDTSFIPPVATNLPLLLISDVPELMAARAEAGAPFDRATLSLIHAMLAAIGVTAAQAGFVTLALRAPPGGVLPDDLLDPLGARMRHYLALARPRALLIFGDRPARALGVADGPARFAGLHKVNLPGSTIPLVAAPHPALMMRRPAAKAQSWRALRQLAGVLD